MKADPHLEETTYLRRRLDPRPGDPHYLHLSDLRLALEQARNRHPCRILDFGCGGSPYRSLFAGSPYHRADLPGPSGLDFIIDERSRLPVPDGCYDLVLSTQVLEHVPSPEDYLAECFRVLRPGGQLLLTTHGTFYDHGSPHDYQRWTADGLQSQIKQAGFQVHKVKKLTTGPRALLLLLEHFQTTLLSARWNWGGVCLRLLRIPFRFRLPVFHRFLDKAFDRHRVVDARKPEHGFYIAILVTAVRPEA